jgi:hypothetical protein
MNINIKRFSRSKVDQPIDTPQQEPEVKRSRGRPKKSEPEVEAKPSPEPESLYEDDSVSDVSEIQMNDDQDFLSDLNNINYKEPPTKEELKEKEKLQKALEKEQRKTRLDLDKIFRNAKKAEMKKPEKSHYEDDSSLFDDKGTELLGRDKRVLLSKIQQYKSLFPEELGKFKIKKNCSAEDLKLYLSEMESIVDTSSVEQFLTDSILQCIKLTEGVSSYTKYDITGCADLLKENKQFHTLTKQMYIKYKVFEKVPPEFSLMMLVATTAYICKNKNSKKKEIEQFLNESIKQPEPATLGFEPSN